MDHVELELEKYQAVGDVDVGVPLPLVMIACRGLAADRVVVHSPVTEMSGTG